MAQLMLVVRVQLNRRSIVAVTVACSVRSSRVVNQIDRVVIGAGEDQQREYQTSVSHLQTQLVRVESIPLRLVGGVVSEQRKLEVTEQHFREEMERQTRRPTLLHQRLEELAQPQPMNLQRRSHLQQRQECSQRPQ